MTSLILVFEALGTAEIAIGTTTPSQLEPITYYVRCAITRDVDISGLVFTRLLIGLTFYVAGELYGLAIADIREIIKVRELTEVPRAPLFLMGVVSVRGVVIPVLDLRMRLRLLFEVFGLMSAGAPFVQFTYHAVAPIPKRLDRVRAEASERIWMNIPPARIWVYRRD